LNFLHIICYFFSFSYDHTYGDYNGVFLFIEASSPVQQGFNAILESTLFLPTPSYSLCMDFWYHMYGTGIGSLNVYINVSNTSSLLWTQNGNKGNQWFNGQLTIKSAKSFRIMIEAVRGKTHLSDIAIDDIDFIERSCALLPSNADPLNQVTVPIITTTRSTKPSTPFSCNFETGICGFRFSSDGTYNWTRVQGTEGPQIAGPIKTDNTLGTPLGWYLFANPVNKKLTDKARFESALISAQKCMEFYYFFSTNSKYKFNIYIKVNDQLGLPIWSKSSSQGEFWRVARVTVNSGIGQYRIVFELTGTENAVLTDKYGIDDIYFTDGACTSSSDVNQLCTFTNKDLCGYKINQTSQIQWQIFSPIDMTRLSRDDYDEEGKLRADVGPITIGDHTTEGGIGSGYVYVQTQGFRINQTAALTSQQYAPFATTNPEEAKRCLEFYYYMQGDDSVTLNVRAITPPPINNYNLWSRNYDHGVYWWKGEANIKLVTNYSIMFEAVVGNNPNNGLVGLDDIILKNGGCSR
jgi:hypothetical protein